MTIEPMTTYRIGKSVCCILLPLSPRNVFTIRFHFNASDTSPPATISPVAGHMTQRSVEAKSSAVIIPCFMRNGGSRTQLIKVPMPMARQMRKPTSKPDPNPSRLTLKPTRIASWPGKNQFSRTHFRVVAVMTTIDASVPTASALTGPADTPLSRPSCNTRIVSPAANPSA